jgi:FtsH-binding integral membrane protein
MSLQDLEPKHRLGFIRKVYGILSVQLAITALITTLVYECKGMHPLFHSTTFMIASIVVYIGTLCSLICCRLDRKVPVNYILLLALTVACSCMVASICIRYSPMIVMEAALLTAAVVVGITVFAFTSKTDFTICGPLPAIFCCLLIVGVTISLVWPFSWNTVWCLLGSVLFSFYLLCDTQMILGGRHRKYQFSEDDYIFAALVLYLDIINLFLYILEALGGK